MTKISRKHKHLVMLQFCALFFFIGAIAVHAATYYVSTTGNDSNPGTQSQPFQTLAKGVSPLNAGDTLYIRGGTYNQPINVGGKSGTAGNYITIAGYPGETVIIRTSNFAIQGQNAATHVFFIFQNLVLDGSIGSAGEYWTIGNNAHDIIIDGIDMFGWQGAGIQIGSGGLDGYNITIRNSKLHDMKSLTCVAGTRWYGTYAHNGHDILYENNDIYNNPGGGMQIYPGPNTNIVIRNNRIHDNNHCTTQNTIGGVVVSTDGVQTNVGTQIYNNLIYNNGSAPSHGSSPGVAVTNGANGTKIWNNTIYGNRGDSTTQSAGYGVVIQGATTVNTVVQNNVIFNNQNGTISNIGGSGSVIDHNLTTDPSFANAAAFDFNLHPSSPAIDAGTPVSIVKTDFMMKPRPQGSTYDIGAYEVGTDSAAPAPPVGLRVN